MTTSQVETQVSDAASVDAAIESRFSCRAFLRDKPVPRELIESLLRVASRAPSGTNTQPWNVVVLQGASRDELSRKVCAAHDEVQANPAAAARYREDFDYYPEKWTSPFIDRRRENGWGLYGLLGIQRGEKEKMHAQHQRNYEFFDAPVGLMFSIDKVLGRGSLMDAAMFIQNVMVAARGHGLHTCPQAAWLDYGTIVKAHAGIPDSQLLLTGMSLGYADLAAPVNRFHTPREPVANFTRWLE
ncbi:nitroreductase [Ramlibacter sp.]|uniref:nitroreductase n=1 Tax=Ramlibacter sp. TaxID=1917967 RepID=UPI003D14566B